MHEVIEISVKDYGGTEFVFLARDKEEAELLEKDIEQLGSLHVNNVLVLKNGEVTGYVEDALIQLSFLVKETLVMRECKDDQPKFALLD